MSETELGYAPAKIARAARSPWADAGRALIRNPAGVAGLLIVGVLALLAILGPFIAPWDYRVQDIA
ncbi:MAG TPA: ABC transporter permease, partial [Candidatus Limnocylindria bacterium]|nr:ABC transporter permease [Candidatus Limnocylindria bacterium]